MTTVERALRVLIHDIRTPVGVAQGYLRLLQQNRLTSGEARDQAYHQALRAMDQLARLASDAERLVDDEPLPAPVAVHAHQLVDRVRACLPEASFCATVAPVPRGVVSVPPDVDRLAEAIGVVLASAFRPATPPPGSVAVGASGGELWFATDAAGPDPHVREPFDPWRVPGLAVPAACRTVDFCGGRLWAGPGPTGGVGIAFPFEVSR